MKKKIIFGIVLLIIAGIFIGPSGEEGIIGTVSLISDQTTVYENIKVKHEQEEALRIEEERKLEEKRIEEEKKLAEEKRIAEEQRLEQEKREKAERIEKEKAEEKRIAEANKHKQNASGGSAQSNQSSGNSGSATPPQKQPTPPPAPPSDGSVVYITKTGEKYHKDFCVSLKRSKYEINISDAKSRGYAPCKICFQ